MCKAAYLCDIEALMAWKASGADLNTVNFDERTPLHIVCVFYAKIEA